MAKKRKFYKRLFIVPIASVGFLAPEMIFTEQPAPLKTLHPSKPKEGYTVNFNNVSALELLKFISKISNTNFIYNPQDLQFTITFTSEEPTSLENIMTAFTQILRINDLSLIEEANNIVIHKNPDVKQITNIVTDNQGLPVGETPFLITRVFNIHNSNPTNLKNILLPLLSQSAVITVVPDTRQIIVMDLASNVNKAAELISYLDMPSSNLQMRSYKFKNAYADNISLILNQLIMPLSEGNPVILVPQKETNTLFIVSTPYLLQKSIEILLQLDQASKTEEKILSLENVLIYKIKSKTFSIIQKGLKDIIDNAQSHGYDVAELANTVQSSQYIGTTNSIVFIGDKSTLEKLGSFLAAMDEIPSPKGQFDNSKFFIYEPKKKSAEEIFSYLKEIEKHLVSSHLGDPSLIKTLETMKVISSANTIIFTGDPNSILEITNLLKSLDLAEFSTIDQFLIYTPMHLSPQTLMESLKQVAKRLSLNGLEDPSFLKSIEEAKYLPSSYAIVFTGSADTIAKVKKTMDDLDALNKRSQLEDNMFVYKLKFISKKILDQSLESFAETLSIDSPVHDTIESRSYLPQSNSFVFKGTQDSLDKIKQILDVSDTPTTSKDQVLMYKIKSSDDALVLENLKNYSAELSSNDSIKEVLKNFKYIPNSHLIIFKGSSDTLKDVESVMNTLDNVEIQSKYQTFNYKVQSHDFKGVLENLKKVQERLSKTDPLYNVLKTAHVVENSNLIIFKGSDQAIINLKDLLAKIDIPQTVGSGEAPSQVIVQLKNASGKTILKNLNILETKLGKDPQSSPSLLQTLKKIEWIESNNTLIISGQKKDVDQILTFVNQFDVAEQEKTDKEELLNYKIKSPNPAQVVENIKIYTDHLGNQDPLYSTFKSMKYIPSSKLIVFKGSAANLKNVSEMLSNFDDQNPQDQISIFNYKIQSSLPKTVWANLKHYQQSLQNQDPLYQVIDRAHYIESSNMIVFKGSQSDINNLKDVLSKIDAVTPSNPDDTLTHVVYTVKNSTGDALLKYLDSIKSRMKKDKINQDSTLLQTLSDVEWSPANGTLYISGPKKDVDQVISFITQYDTKEHERSNLIYKLDYLQGDQAIKELKMLGKSIKNPTADVDTIEKTINSIEWIQSTNSLFITGRPSDIDEIVTLLKGIDISAAKKLDGNNTEFIIYRPINLSAKNLKISLDKVASDLEQSQLADPALLQSLKGIKFSEHNQALVITGNDVTIKKVKEVLATIDIPPVNQIQANFLNYKSQYLTAKDLKKSLIKLVEGISGDPDIHDPVLIKAIQNAQLIESSNTVLFTGNEDTLKKISQLIASVDSPTSKEILASDNSNFFIYKPEHLKAEQVKKSLDSIANDLEKTGLADKLLINAIKTSRLAENNRSIVFTGNNDTLAKIKEMVTTIDVANEKIQPENPNFVLYKAINLPASEIHDHLLMIAHELEKSGLSDPKLIQTIKSSKVIEQSHSIAFTGDETTLAKVKDLVSSIDVVKTDKNNIQHLGQTTFIIYRIQAANPVQLMEGLRALAKDISKAKAGDQELIKTIDNMRYVDETHSIVFTGSVQTLNKLSSILEKLDVASPVKPEPTRVSADNYALYQPRNLSGDELIRLLKDFETNLKSTGVKDHSLIDSISNLKWMPKTSTIIITGNQEAIAKVQALLEKFDVIGRSSEKKPEVAIETIEDTSFLIYKVQYHEGESIQKAIRGIGSDLSNHQSASTQALVSAINSLKLIEVTNSLVATGDPKALTRLKELIMSVDVPLKQVFIELLVIETDITSLLQFGLRWATQGNYKDRLAFSAASLAPSDAAGITNPNFASQVQAVSATTPPNAQNLPMVTGGSLGVIGDLIFHKGKTYVSLGDFVNAIQNDNDSTIVLNQKIITQDNKQSTLFVGQNLPYNGSVVTNQSQTTTISANIEYLNVGINLSIKPKVGEDEIITMTISQDISEQVGTGQTNSSDVNTIYGIQTRRTTLDTSVHVPNKHFVVLTGQIRDTTVRNKSAIPCLGGLPLIGAAFADNLINKQASTIIMFIKPHIVNTYEEYKKITERQEDIYRENGVAEDFDFGVEIVKDPDDL